MESVLQFNVFSLSTCLTICDRSFQRATSSVLLTIVSLVSSTVPDTQQMSESIDCIGESKIRSVVFYSLWPHGLYSPWNSPGQITGVGRLSLLQGIFPTQGSSPGLLHCRQILYQVSHRCKWVTKHISQDFPLQATKTSMLDLRRKEIYHMGLLGITES